MIRWLLAGLGLAVVLSADAGRAAPAVPAVDGKPLYFFESQDPPRAFVTYPIPTVWPFVPTGTVLAATWDGGQVVTIYLPPATTPAAGSFPVTVRGTRDASGDRQALEFPARFVGLLGGPRASLATTYDPARSTITMVLPAR